MVAPPAGGTAPKREGVVPRDAWARWALALLAVSAAASVLGLFFPWWEWRTYNTAFAGTVPTSSSTSLWDTQWCWFDRGLGSCHSYTWSPGDTSASALPPGLAASMSSLEILHIVVMVASVVACATYAFPRIRAQLLRVPALAALVATVLAWVAVAYAWIAIPGTEATAALPGPGFTWVTWSTSGGQLVSGEIAGAGNLWFLLLLAAGTGIEALLAMRAAARRTRRSGTVSSDVR